ncbi:MAG TPA: response regulator [Puia sp.]|nr:response regulator [Puia sp.]
MDVRPPYLLLADDDPEDRQLLSDEFTHQNPGIGVHHAADGQEVLQYLNNCEVGNLPLVLVLDYQMPDLNAPQILLRLTANSSFRRIVKVVWSSSQRIKDMEDCKRLGASHYLVKPSTVEELKRSVRQLTAILNFASGSAGRRAE